MGSRGIVQYFRMIVPSIVIMILIAYGMAVGNPWIQYGSILIVIGLQLAYQIIKSIRSAPILDANMRAAVKAKSGRLLLTAIENDVIEVKRQMKDTGEMGISSKTFLMFLAPLAIFFAAGQILSMIAPELPRWQSYLIGFLLSLPASIIITIKAGAGSATGPLVTPNAYYVSEKGIIFEHIGRPFIIFFPIKKLNVKKEKKFIEVEGQPTGSLMIPNRLRLFNQDVDQLQRLLNRFTETKAAST